jgi:hypothetical protein
MSPMAEQIHTGVPKIFVQVLETKNDYVSEANLTIEIVFTAQYQPQVLAISRYVSAINCSFRRNLEPTIFAGRLQFEVAQSFLDDIFTVISEPQMRTGNRRSIHTPDELFVIWENYHVPKLGDSGRLHFRGRNIPQKLQECFLGDVQGEQTKDFKKRTTLELRYLPVVISDIAYEFKSKLHEISHPIKQLA